jgi:Na+/melibiose symporter-like transporter
MASAIAPVPVPAATLPRRSLAAYAAFGLPVTMTALPMNILLPDFYAGTTGLALTTIGLALLATRLLDAVVDPLLGSWVDAQRQRGSSFLPILFGALPLAAGFALLFNPRLAGGGDTATTVWLFATLACAYLGYSLATIAYQAWGAELAHDDAGRARVTASREGAGLIGVLIGGTVPTVAGMPSLVATFIVLLALGLWLLGVFAPRPVRAGARRLRGNPFTDFVEPLRSARLRWLLAIFALNAIAPAITATVFQFFVADRLGLANYTGAFLALYFVAGAASMPLWIRLARVMNLQAIWLAGMVAAVAAFVWAYGLDASQGTAALYGFAAICVLSGLAFGSDLALPPALLARVIEANGDGGRREGVYFGLWNFVNKLCLATAGGIALPMLETLGYSRGAQDAQALAALAFTYAVVPCALKLVAAGALWFAWSRDKF